MVQRSARLGEARLGETRLGEGVITFEQELSDTQPIVDQPRYEFTRHVLLDDTQSILDEPTVLPEGLEVAQISETISVVDAPRYETVLHRFGDDSTTVADDAFRKYILHRFGDDTIGFLDDLFTKLGFIQENDDSITIVDDPRYETLLHRFADDSTTLDDDARYETFLHRFLDDSQSVLDEVLLEALKIFERFGDDSVSFVDDLFRQYILHRYGDDSTTPVDDPRYETFLHRFLDDSQSLLDEELLNFVFPPIQLSDLIYAAGESNFDEVFWDKTYFDTDVLGTKGAQIFNRFGDDALSFLDDIRYITFLHRFADDTTTLGDDIFRKYILHRFADDSTTVVDDVFREYILHRFLDDSSTVLDDIFIETILTILRELSDRVYVAGKAGFNEVYWDKIYFDQDVQLVFDLVREFSESQPVADDVRYTTFLHRFLDDVQTLVDDSRYTYILHRLLDDTQSILDELFTEFSLAKIVRLSDIVYPADISNFDEVYWDKSYFDQRVQLIFDLVREFADSLNVLDVPRYTTFLHRFLDDTQSIPDEIFVTFGTVISALLDDLVYAVDESRFDQVYFNKANFDDAIRITYTLHRYFQDTISFLDELRGIYILHRQFADVIPILDEIFREEIVPTVRISDLAAIGSKFDFCQWDGTRFGEGDKIRITYILHRYFQDLLSLTDAALALRVAIRRLADSQTLADTFFIFEGGLIIPLGSILRLHRLGSLENALLLFPLDVSVEKSERADSIQIPFGDDVIQATGTSKKRIRIDCLWVENGDQDEESLKANLIALENATQIKVTFFLQHLLTKDYRPVNLESFSVQKVRGRSDILRVRLIFVEDTN